MQEIKLVVNDMLKNHPRRGRAGSGMSAKNYQEARADVQMMISHTCLQGCEGGLETRYELPRKAIEQ